MIELMGGELMASSPSGIAGELGTKIVFTIKTYSGEKQEKLLNFSEITSLENLKTLIIIGGQVRDEDIFAVIHQLGLQSSVTTYQKTTVNQIKANLGIPSERYNLIIISDDKEFDGFEAAKAIWENKLSSEFIIMLVSSNDKQGNYLKCLTAGVDNYLVKPFDLEK